MQAFDTVAADEESLNLAQEKFKDLLEVGHICVMCAAASHAWWSALLQAVYNMISIDLACAVYC